MEKQHRRSADTGGGLVSADKIQTVTDPHCHDARSGESDLGRVDEREIDREY
jgi:hypothetical protein